jgi:hypothetical protein
MPVKIFLDLPFLPFSRSSRSVAGGDDVIECMAEAAPSMSQLLQRVLYIYTVCLMEMLAK